MTKITRGSVILLSSILAVALLITAVCSFALSPLSRSPADATTETDYAVTQNLFNTDGTLNRSAVNSLLDAINYDSYSATRVGYTAHNLQNRTNDNSGNTIIFPMGYVNGTSGANLYWQATYLYNGYLTVWLVKGYTNSAWNSSSVNVNYDTYANSTIQNYINSTFQYTVTQGSPSLQAIFATPATAGYQILASGTTNDSSYYYTSNEQTQFNNMSTTVGQNSLFWLPSAGEVWANTTSSVTISTTSYTGQWGLNTTDRIFNTTNYDNTTTNFTWTRSKYDANSTNPIRLAYGGGTSSTANSCTESVGVRPACHMSLDILTMTATITSDSQDKASVSDIMVSPSSTGDFEYTFIYTANEGYSISQVKINNAIVAISEVQPEEFAYAVGCEYKCFRDQNQVYVIVTGLWEDVTIEASCDILFTTNTLTTDLQVVSSTATSSGSTLDARIILQYNWTPNVRFRLDGGEWNQLVGSNGGGILGTSTYSFSRHEAKFYIIIEIYGLSQTTHSVEVDYYAGGGGGITPSVYNNSGYATFEQYVDDNITRVVVTPASNTYVTALYIDNVRFPVQYYRAEVFGAGMATAIQYIAHETNNTFVVLAQDVYRTMAIEFELSNSLPTLQEPPSSGGTLLTGTVATASAGGEVRMTGFSGDETENSTLHFVALAYSGYEFAGWQVDGEILEGYSAIADIPYSLVDGKIVTAVFEPKDSDSSTNSSLNDPNHGADIL